MAQPKTGITLALILACQAALGCFYLNRTAVFNAPDEPYHLNYIAFLSARGRLPEASSRLMSEAIQPPLYYASAVPLYRLTSGLDLPERVRLLRAQNLFYSILNVWLIFLLLRRVSDDKTALLGAAFAAFLPQYLFIGSSVTNDALADLLATLILYGGIRLLESPQSLPRVIGEGLLTGAGLLAKLTTLCCAAAADLVYVRQEINHKTKAAGRMLAASGAAVLLGGWPLWRNWKLYGDIAGERAMFHESAMPWKELGPWCLKLFESFWGLFAWMASPLPKSAYVVLALISAAVVFGFLAWLRSHPQERRKPGAALLFSAAGLALAQTFYQGFLHARQPQGRYLFPALGPIAFIFALGAFELWRRIPRRFKPTLAILLVFGELTLQILSFKAL